MKSQLVTNSRWDKINVNIIRMFTLFCQIVGTGDRVFVLQSDKPVKFAGMSTKRGGLRVSQILTPPPCYLFDNNFWSFYMFYKICLLFFPRSVNNDHINA